MLVKDAVAERIRALCAQRGIKVNELANLSGVTPSTVYSINELQQQALLGIKEIAYSKSCNAIIGIHFDYLDCENGRFIIAYGDLALVQKE